MKSIRPIILVSIITILGGEMSVFSSQLITVQDEEPRPLLRAPTPATIPMPTYVVDVNRIVDKMAEQGSLDRVYVNITPGKVMDSYGSNFKGELSHDIDSHSDNSVSSSHSQKSRGKTKFGLNFEGLGLNGSGGDKSSSHNMHHVANIQEHQNHLERTREEGIAFCRVIQQPGLTLEITCAPRNTSVLTPLSTRSLEQRRFERLNLPQIGSNQEASASQASVPNSQEDLAKAKRELDQALSGF